MRSFLILMLISLNVFAQGPASVIPSKNPDAIISVPGKVLTASPRIDKLADGSFGIKVLVTYRSFGRNIGRHIYSFPLIDEVSFVQRGTELSLVYEGQEKPMAQRKWWYSNWVITNKNIQLKANVKKIDAKSISLNPQILILE